MDFPMLSQIQQSSIETPIMSRLIGKYSQVLTKTLGPLDSGGIDCLTGWYGEGGEGGSGGVLYRLYPVHVLFFSVFLEDFFRTQNVFPVVSYS